MAHLDHSRRSLLCGALLGLCAAACNRRGLSERLREEAGLRIRQGRLKEAESALRRALDYDPGDGIALERLLELYVRQGNYEAGTRWLSLVGDHSSRSVLLDNLALRIRLHALSLDSAVQDATTLEKVGRLLPETERDLIAALTRTEPEGLGSARVLADPSLLEPWFVAAMERLLEAKRWESAAPPLAGRAVTPAVARLRTRFLERLRAEGWAISDSALESLTANPTDAPSYLGRLELLLRTGRETEALRLNPADELWTDDWANAWDQRFTRYFAQRSDWYGVLARSERPSTSARDEARRRALRALAHLRRRDARAARAELAAWLSDPHAAEYWGEALLQPELAPYRDALTELRAGRDRRRRP